MDIRSRGGLVGLAGVAILAGVAVASAFAGSSRAASPPPCELPDSSVAAGQPFELSGPTVASDGLVEIVARNERGYLREGDFRQDGRGWRGTITFRSTDVGPWTIEVLNGTTSCRSPLTVTLAPGMTAPPADAGFVDETLVPPPPPIDGGQVIAGAALAAVALVLASWLFLAIVAAGGVAGRRPLAGATPRRLARGAAFLGVLGAVTGAALFVDFEVSMSHFDTGTPDAEQAVLNVAIAISVLVGITAGTMAARRIGRSA